MKRFSSRNSQQDVTLDQILDALAQQRRRQILLKLATDNPRHEDEFNSENEALNRSRSRNYHVHLPKLDDAEFIEWDQEENTVMRGPRFEEIQPFLELVKEYEDTSSDDGP